MIGKLTIDKSSMNMSYFLYTILIISKHNGLVSRKTFVEEMAAFVGVPAVKDGKENRTAYNKSKMVRYFGFADVVVGSSTEQHLVLTNRGKILIDYIKDNGDKVDSENRYSILPECRSKFVDLIFESVIFDSFGKNNSGAEQSNTDVEPPKVVFKTLLELERATADEICHVLYGLNRGVYKSFDEAIDEVKKNRARDYTELNDQWGITNIVGDCKIIDIFTDSSIQLITEERDEETGKKYYRLSTTLGESHKKQIQQISAVYQPVRMFTYSNNNIDELSQWIDSAILGRISDEEQLVRFDWSSISTTKFCSLDGSDFEPSVFENAVLTAYNNEKRNIYIVLKNIIETDFFSTISRYSSLLKYTNEFISDKHGWSESEIEDSSFYDFLVVNSSNARGILNKNRVRLPSNLHIVGSIIMNNVNDINFDYKFQRCLVNSSESEIDVVIEDVNDKKVLGGYNKIFYGAPGCGKSFIVNKMLDEANVIDENRFRVTFHPEYSNCDFVGQILPTIENKINEATGKEEEIVKYKVNPGPFTLALERARQTNDMVYLIIEEINRGNAAAIFGDLFQLLDRVNDQSKTNWGESEYPICNVIINDYLRKDKNAKMVIPSNLTIYATMNTSDQNVFTLDTAFKRRWSFEQISNNIEKDIDHKYKGHYVPGTDVTWEKFLTVINKEILKHKITSEDKRMGKYFVSKDCLTETVCDIVDVKVEAEKFAYKVLEYIWNDVCKISKDDWFDTSVLLTLEDLIDAFVNPKEDESPLAVFKTISFK